MTNKRIIWNGPPETGDTPAVTVPAPEYVHRLMQAHDDVTARIELAEARGQEFDALEYATELAAGDRNWGAQILDHALTEDEAVQLICEKDCPDATAEIVDVSEIPSDRTFRNQWRRNIGGKKLDTDMSLARPEQMRRLRVRRNERIAELDGQEMEAMSKNDAPMLQKVRKLKQRLRDMPRDAQAAIDAASTPAELAAVDPSVLRDQVG